MSEAENAHDNRGLTVGVLSLISSTVTRIGTVDNKAGMPESAACTVRGNEVLAS